MKRLQVILAAAALALASAALFAATPAHIRYSVDASTTTPSATVVTRQGVTVVIFKVPSLSPGDKYSLTIAMTPSKAGRAGFPVTAFMAEDGDVGKVSANFLPDVVDFTGTTDTESAVVTLTLLPADYTKTKRMVVLLKADPTPGSKLAKGPGVKVVIMKAKASESPAGDDPEGAMLRDVEEALGATDAPAPTQANSP